MANTITIPKEEAKKWDGVYKLYPEGRYTFEVVAINPVKNSRTNIEELQVEVKFLDGTDDDGTPLAGTLWKAPPYKPHDPSQGAKSRFVNWAVAVGAEEPDPAGDSDFVFDTDEAIGRRFMATLTHYTNPDNDKTYPNLQQEEAVTSNGASTRKKK